MTTLSPLEDLLILVIAALLPALLYLTWVRQSERFMTEPWGPVLRAFFYGAIVATVVSAILEVILVAAGTAVSQRYPAPEFTFLNANSTFGLFFLVLVIAPFTEEALKAAGVTGVRDRFRMVSDGLVFGAAVGLGFGFFETFLYGLGAFVTGGLAAGLLLIFVRSISSVLVHGSTTAMFGYGYAESTLRGKGHLGAAYYLVAVGMHASFNALASLGPILLVLGLPSGLTDYASLLGLIAAVFFAFAAIEHARTVIQRTNFPGAEAVYSKFRPPAVRATVRPPSRPR